MTRRMNSRRGRLSVETSPSGGGELSQGSMKILALPLSRPTSFFLDLLRLAAASSVFLVHVIYLWYPVIYNSLIIRLGHRAVIIFFVLSGYVIAYSTLRKAAGVRSFVLARLSRLYSVVMPALLLTGFLQILGTVLNPHFYMHLEPEVSGFLRYVLTGFSSVAVVAERRPGLQRSLLVARLRILVLRPVRRGGADKTPALEDRHSVRFAF